MQNYHRKYFGLRKEVAPLLDATYASRLIDLLRLKGHRIQRGGLTVTMAREFGFCVGVERAIQMAYETRQKFPDKRIFITTEIIHNPFVNRKLVEMGFLFLGGTYATGMTYDDIAADDVVILPAFGAPVPEVRTIQAKGALIVDTTCGAVVNVWNNVQKYARDGFTSVIHGKYSHEETIATSSRAAGETDGITGTATAQPAHYIVVRDLDEARAVCEYIDGRGTREAFLTRFKPPAVSAAFDPDRDLQRIGLANQTTMLSGESLAIQALLREAFVRRFGEEETRARFRSFDTICSATQDRQDAVLAMLKSPVDLLLVIGGYNSSNTTHLAEMGLEHRVPTFHLDDATCLLDRRQIRHQPVGKRNEVIAENWWPEKDPLFVAVTAGASTPNNKISDVILRLFELYGADVTDLLKEIEALPDQPGNAAPAGH
jgi:4-hydroxy-3-methylbut-2-enyl diphosphate reductase